MSDKNTKLSELEIRELFQKYDVNKDGTIDQEELSLYVKDMYLKNHSIKNTKDLTLNDESKIKISVEELLKGRDHNKDGSLQLEEFLAYHHGHDIVQSTGIDNFKLKSTFSK